MCSRFQFYPNCYIFFRLFQSQLLRPNFGLSTGCSPILSGITNTKQIVSLEHFSLLNPVGIWEQQMGLNTLMAHICVPLLLGPLNMHLIEGQESR